MKKYIFLDIDGTLNNSQKEVSIANIKAIEKISKKDIEIVFCSGRTNIYLQNLSKKCKCSRYLISSNGSMIYDQKYNKVLHCDQIPYEILKKVYDYCLENKIAITFNTDSYRYCNKYVEKNKYFQYDTTKIIDNIDEVKDKFITQFVVGSYNYEKMLSIKEFIEAIPIVKIVNISTTIKLKLKKSKDGFFYDVVSAEINKGSGINNFMKLLGIDKSNCIAIGDHINDLEMFEQVGYKIAMGNGYEELKSKADFITKSNDEDGVKYALEHIEKEIY